MARNKAIFDADILINMVKTKSFKYLISMFEQIYISDYVWEKEIKNGTEEKKVLTKLKNKGFIILLEYDRLTDKQQAIYKQAYNILNNKAPSEYVNEDERRTVLMIWLKIIQSSLLHTDSQQSQMMTLSF